VDLYSALRLHL